MPLMEDTVVTDDPELESEPRTKISISTFRRMLPFFSGYQHTVAAAVAMVLARTGILACLPLVFRELVDSSIPSQQYSRIAIAASIYLLMLVAQGTLEYYQSLIVGFMGIRIVNTIKQQLLAHIFTLSIRFFDHHKVGKLISRVESDSQRLYMAFSSVGLQLLGALLMLGISLIIMISTSVQLTLYALAAAPLFLGGLYAIFFKMRPLFRQDRELYANITGFLTEHIPAVVLLRNLNNTAWSRKKMADLNREKTRFSIRVESLEVVLWFFMLLAPVLAITGILYRSVSWIPSGDISIGTVWMFIQYIQLATMPLIMISEQISELQKAMGAAERIFDLFDTQPEISNPVRPVADKPFTNELRFERVSFHYESDKPVLADLSFSIAKGSRVAVVGPTGAGKSTVISLLTRLYDPTSGCITLDGTDLRAFKQDDLRKKVSLVMQDIFLFPGTVLDNLRALRSDIPAERVYEAVQALGIEHIINGLPAGYDTVLAEQGANLSFGQRQLLSFARALTFNPDILIIDEATSAVDPYTEKHIQRSLDKLLEGRTAVMIAHRLSTIINADKIIVLDRGHLVEEGSHAELLRSNGMYAALYRLQESTTSHKPSTTTAV